MKKGRLITVIAVLILLTGAGAYYLLLRRPQNKNTVWKTTPVEKGALTVNVTATGSLNALTTVEVGAQVNGTVAKLYSDFNSRVKEGQVIALLDTTFLSASRQDAEAMVERAQAQADEARIEYERNKILYETNTIAKSDFDVSNANYLTARSSLRSAQAQLNRARINLQYATIRAPISGVVISRNVDIGQMVISSFNSPVLYTIANDLHHMQVVADVDEADIGEVQEGQEVSFTVDAYPDERFTGIVKQKRLQPLVVQNVVNYAVIIDVPNPDLKLMPGLTANIIIKIHQEQDVLKVPVSALRFQPSLKDMPDSLKAGSNAGRGAMLWIKKGSAIIPVNIRPGLSDGSFVSVAGNLQEGDEVVTGIASVEEEAAHPQNPFMPKFPTHPKR